MEKKQDKRADQTENQSLDELLKGQYVAVPESRQLDILEDLLQKRGARVLRLPLVSIHDAPDPAPVEAWLQQIIARPCRIFIILTGEGLRRLRGFSQRAGCEQAFTAALGQMQTLCRGPKPGRALHEMGLKPDSLAAEPTTAGVIQTLEAIPLEGVRVAVQLYGEDPNRLLMDYLERRGAQVLKVSPYVYADATEEARVVDFISGLEGSGITAMLFTSQPQYERLRRVAQKHGLEEVLAQGLQALLLVAVGPVVAEQLRQAGLTVEVMPESSYFMKPMVTALVRKVQETVPGESVQEEVVKVRMETREDG